MRRWYNGDSKNDYDHCVCHIKLLDDNSFVELLLYVNDILIEIKNLVKIYKLKTQLNGS